MSEPDLDRRLSAVAALGDGLRRSLYRFVAEREEAVGRDEAAAAAGVTRAVAAFHLDRLVACGLLTAEFRRRSGRGGPGAGRPAKLYRRSATEVAVSLPPRNYELAARLLASAVTEAATTGCPIAAAVDTVAREWGRTVASSGPASPLDALAEQGYEPRLVGGEIVLGNCPFHAVAAHQRPLVCGINLALLEAFAEARGGGLEARLEPDGAHCCVRLRAPARRRMS